MNIRQPVTGARSAPPHHTDKEGDGKRGLTGNGCTSTLRLSQQVSDANCSGNAQRIWCLKGGRSGNEENRLSGQDDWTQQAGGH